MSKFKFASVLLSLSALTATPSAIAANTVIDVLVAYTPAVGQAYSGDPTTRINQLFALTNQIYADSGVALELNLVKTVQVNYTDDNSAETALNHITQASDAAFAGIPALRDQFKADMVILYRPYKQVQQACGVAWIGGNQTNGVFSSAYKGYMYSTLAISTCPDFVTAHELGHNMGLAHSRKQDGVGGTFPYALGYGIDGQFTTIMAYESSFGDPYGNQKILKFSSPLLTCKGVPCGVDRSNNSTGADAAYTLGITAPQIAEYYAGSVGGSSSSSSSSSSGSLLSGLAATVTSTKATLDAANAAVATNLAAIKTKQAAQVAAKSTVAAANSAAKAAKTAYNAAVKAASSAASKVTKAASAVTKAQAKYDTAKPAAQSAAQAALNTANTAYTAAVAAKATADAAVPGKQNALDAATAALASATSAYTVAANKLSAEKALSAGLKAAAKSASTAYNAAVKAYNAAAKKAGIQ
jgi:peptidyl-Asp metalloendopeptidase